MNEELIETPTGGGGVGGLNTALKKSILGFLGGNETTICGE